MSMGAAGVEVDEVGVGFATGVGAVEGAAAMVGGVGVAGAGAGPSGPCGSTAA
jgi:hypothetical protein